jgi:hypothetical protein
MRNQLVSWAATYSTNTTDEPPCPQDRDPSNPAAADISLRPHGHSNTNTATIIPGHAAVQLVEAMRYKLEGHGFDSGWCHWNFSLT